MVKVIAGGITFGYFTFEYKGFDPQLVLLARNTFDPLDTLFERLGIPQNVIQTTNAERAAENLVGVIDSGKPALVWADYATLPYNCTAVSESWWAMLPLVVYGIDEQTAYIADRSRKPLTVPADVLALARARVKKDKFRVMTLGEPDLKKLPGAVKKGMEQCIRLFTQPPPRGTRNNFGLKAIEYWGQMLINTRNKQSWARLFAPGRKMYAALAGFGAVPGAFRWISVMGAGKGLERALYADFLEEAAALLFKSKLESAARFFRQSSQLWGAFADALLPDDTRLLQETRELEARRHTLFVNEGNAAIPEIHAINARLHALREQAANAFPWDEAQAAARRARWSQMVLEIRSVEEQAIKAMHAAIS